MLTAPTKRIVPVVLSNTLREYRRDSKVLRPRGGCLQAAVEPVPGTVVLKNTKGTLEAHVLPTGVIIQRLLVPDKAGKMVDVVLGYDTLEPYIVSPPNSTTHAQPPIRHPNTPCLLRFSSLLSV